jgi:methylated-DNA-[protein]-cysteine S-methyltransferase
VTTLPLLVLVTPDGPFGIVTAEDGAVLASGWTDSPEALRVRIHPSLRPDALALSARRSTAADAALAYYDGDLAAIDAVPVRQHAGGGFRTLAWDGLRRIVPGAPLTYAGFAEALGRPTAVRAAAGACASNAPALFVPCHRVLRTDGGLGGFAWGVPVKRALLEREAAA